MAEKKPHPAVPYNQRRAIILSKYNRGIKEKQNLEDLYDELLKWIRNYRHVKKMPLSARGAAGLEAELTFFHRKHDELHLTPGGDFGDKCDFVGQNDKKRLVRFDVTTNVKVKAQQHEEFTKLMRASGHDYVIAEISDIDSDIVYYPLPLPCPNDDGVIFHSVAISQEHVLPWGSSSFVEIKEFCTEEPGMERTLHQIGQWEDLASQLVDFYFEGESYIEITGEEEERKFYYMHVSDEEEAWRLIEEHYSMRARYYEKEFDLNIGTIAEEGHHHVGYKGEDFEYGDKVVWTSGWAREFIYDMTGEII